MLAYNNFMNVLGRLGHIFTSNCNVYGLNLIPVSIPTFSLVEYLFMVTLFIVQSLQTAVNSFLLFVSLYGELPKL